MDRDQAALPPGPDEKQRLARENTPHPDYPPDYSNPYDPVAELARDRAAATERRLAREEWDQHRPMGHAREDGGRGGR